jgi:transposase-like protein
VREGGVIASQAVLVAVALDGEGRRQTLGVDPAQRESTSSWRDFLLGLKVRIVPNTRSCLRLVRALAVETHEDWLESPRYLNRQHLREHQKQQMRAAA